MMLLLFEVMDKEFSLAFLWGVFGGLGVLGFLLVRKHPAFLALAVAIWLLFAPLHISELNDPLVGPHIVREAGNAYVWQSYLAISLGAVLPMLGLAAWISGRNPTKGC